MIERSQVLGNATQHKAVNLRRVLLSTSLLLLALTTRAQSIAIASDTGAPLHRFTVEPAATAVHLRRQVQFAISHLE